MAKIDSFNFGFIVVDEKQYAYDVVILPDGTVKERTPGKGRLGSHTVARGEVEALIREQPDEILIGTGVDGMCRLARDAEVYMFEPNVNMTMLPSPQIVRKYNQRVEDGEKVAALIHVTC
ncbi:MAG TPA: MTH938/NDUFAF3 family protein [Dehalococcoidales bacterium]